MTTTTQTGRGPVHRITRGKVEAAIWEREGKKGRFFQVSFSRPYKTQDGGFGSSENFGHGQLGELVLAAAEAAVWMEAARQPRRREDAERAEYENGAARARREDVPEGDEAEFF